MTTSTNNTTTTNFAIVINILVTLTGFRDDKYVPVLEEQTFLEDRPVFRPAVIKRTEQFIRSVFEFAGAVKSITVDNNHGATYDPVGKIATVPLAVAMDKTPDPSKLAKAVKALDKEDSPFQKGRFVLGVDVLSDSLPEPKGLLKDPSGLWTLYTTVADKSGRLASAVFRMKIEGNPFYRANLDIGREASKESFSPPASSQVEKTIEATMKEELAQKVICL